jgi:Na+/H+-translocating membrane pyrophosphatase
MLIRKNKDVAERIVSYYDNFNEHDIKLLQIAFFASPVIILVFLQVFSFNYALKFLIMSLIISLLSLVYAVHIFVWIMKKDSGTQEMKVIADAISDGSEGFFRAQYGTIFKLSLVFAFGIMVVYFTRSTHQDQLEQTMGNFSMALFSGISFMCGAVCSALSGYAGMWVSVRANIRYTYK